MMLRRMMMRSRCWTCIMMRDAHRILLRHNRCTIWMRYRHRSIFRTVCCDNWKNKKFNTSYETFIWLVLTCRMFANSCVRISRSDSSEVARTCNMVNSWTRRAVIWCYLRCRSWFAWCTRYKYRFAALCRANTRIEVCLRVTHVHDWRIAVIQAVVGCRPHRRWFNRLKII